VLQRSLDTPPVAEAVAGIEFRGRGLDVVGLVRESEKWNAEYPLVTAQPPLPGTRPIGQPSSEIEFQFGPGLETRLWSASEDQAWLVQTQDDRVLLNWRRIHEGNLYPGYEAIRTAFESALSKLDRPNGEPLVPLVAEFTFVNQIPASPALHDTYSVFRKPDQPLPGDIVAERYEAVTRTKLDIGLAQLSVIIQPANAEPGATMLTIATKLFAASPFKEDRIVDLIDSAHALSKKAFFAIVSDDTTKRWGTSDGA